jgi:uncharacterized protein (DUF3084 family)
MQGARWGWIAFIAAIGILFAASNHDHTSNHKVASLLRQELKTIVEERDASRQSLDSAQNELAASQLIADQLAADLQHSSAQLQSLKAERDKLKKELSLLNLDRSQLQQTVASLQLERSQTKRNVEQLRQGLHQLLSQADNVAQVLANPAPGFAQISFELATPIVKAMPQAPASAAGTYYADEPLNDNQ